MHCAGAGAKALGRMREIPWPKRERKARMASHERLGTLMMVVGVLPDALKRRIVGLRKLASGDKGLPTSHVAPSPERGS